MHGLVVCEDWFSYSRTSSLICKRSRLLNSKEEFLHSCLIGCDFSFLCAEMNATCRGFLSLSSFCAAPSIGIVRE
ncbi:unnamed protein product [Musa textilis]